MASASLFHQSSFCHTLKECYRHNEPSAACFFSGDAFYFALGPNLLTIPDVRVLRFLGDVAEDSDLLGSDAVYYGIPTFRGNALSASARAGMPPILPDISNLEDEDITLP
jgi:hypothetical protein